MSCKLPELLCILLFDTADLPLAVGQGVRGCKAEQNKDIANHTCHLGSQSMCQHSSSKSQPLQQPAKEGGNLICCEVFDLFFKEYDNTRVVVF